ncbi:hypothetical protein AA0111_g12342 [Alternaria arborescens]|nr:hypothetical protein AA0111_g12342 [Alternaria arborescens]RYO13154.1 hypothetical protein AA0111_g12342 [Alternaria arborescens]
MSPNGPEAIPHAIANFFVTKLTEATLRVQEKNTERKQKTLRQAEDDANREAIAIRRRQMGDIDDENRSLMGDREAE